MEIKCVRKTEHMKLTIGKTYHVVEVCDSGYKVENDNGGIFKYNYSYFEKVLTDKEAVL